MQFEGLLLLSPQRGPHVCCTWSTLGLDEEQPRTVPANTLLGECHKSRNKVLQSKLFIIISLTLSDASVAQLVEHHLAKVNVESSSLFARSTLLALQIQCVCRAFCFGPGPIREKTSSGSHLHLQIVRRNGSVVLETSVRHLMLLIPLFVQSRHSKSEIELIIVAHTPHLHRRRQTIENAASIRAMLVFQNNPRFDHFLEVRNRRQGENSVAGTFTKSPARMFQVSAALRSAMGQRHQKFATPLRDQNRIRQFFVDLRNLHAI